MLTAPSVPREFLGQARLFCGRIDAATQAAGGAVRQIMGDARAIVKKRTRWRPEHLPGFEQQWRRTMPTEGRLGFEVGRGKHSLIIADIRLIFTKYEDVRWSEPEPTTSITLAV
jgi:hypothetical protein